MLIEMHVHFSDTQKSYLNLFLEVLTGQVSSSKAPLTLSYTKYRHLSLYFSFAPQSIPLQHDLRSFWDGGTDRG